MLKRYEKSDLPDDQHLNFTNQELREKMADLQTQLSSALELILQKIDDNSAQIRGDIGLLTKTMKDTSSTFMKLEPSEY